MTTTAEKLKAAFEYVRTGQQPQITLKFDTPETMLLTQAAHELAVALGQVKSLKATLEVYAKPEFYAELPPSRAKDDQGQMARNVLQVYFPE